MARENRVIVCSLPLAKNAIHSPTSIEKSRRSDHRANNSTENPKIEQIYRKPKNIEQIYRNPKIYLRRNRENSSRHCWHLGLCGHQINRSGSYRSNTIGGGAGTPDSEDGGTEKSKGEAASKPTHGGGVGLVPFWREHWGKTFVHCCGNATQTTSDRQYEWNKRSMFNFSDSLLVGTFLTIP